MGLSGLVIASLVLLLLPSESVSDMTDFNFTRFDGKEPDLIYQGDAHIPVSSYDVPQIRLTSAYDVWLPSRRISIPFPLPDSVGRVVYSPPIRLWDRAARRQANFQTVITLFIGNYWGIPLADGVSFFIAPINTTIPPGSTRGHMGLYNASGSSPTPLLAVELDASVNSWDPRFRHVGINVNSRTSESVAFWGIRETVGGEVEARITYDMRRRLISVVANTRTTHTDTVTARCEHSVDLKTILPEWVQIGISASTAQSDAAQHEIRAWSFISFMLSDDNTYIL